MKKIVLVLLLILILGMFGNSWADDRTHAANPEEVADIRRPDFDLLDLLYTRQFDELDRRLNAMQAAYENDTNKEVELVDTFRWIGVPDPELEGLYQEWLNKYPESYAANLALGTYYNAMAWEWRGTDYFAETHTWRIANSKKYFEKAIKQLEKSLAMTNKPTASYAQLIDTARFYGYRDVARRFLVGAMKSDPYCIKPRISYMVTLEPNWGGSYQAMRQFADETRKGGHPKLEKTGDLFDAWLHWHNGWQESHKNNYVAALENYEKAISISDAGWFRRYRSFVYDAIGQTELEMIDLNRSLKMEPYEEDTYYMRGIALLDKRQTKEALKDLHLAAKHGSIDAMRKLGELYTTGNMDVPLDVKNGMKWWSKAAYFWDEHSCFAIGRSYEGGLGVEEDKEKAVEYYRIAADQGYGPALNNLGMMLWYGKGVPANRDEAARLWVMGAEQDIWQCKHNLQYFLSPFKRLRLAISHPLIIVGDLELIRTIIWMISGSVVVILLTVILVAVSEMRRTKALKNTRR